MKEAGLEPDIVPWTPYGDNYPAVLELLSRANRPTAIYSMEIVDDIMLVAKELGLRVPEDLSILGMRDPSFVHTFAMPNSLGGIEPSMYDLPMEEMGGQAVEMLVQKINDPATTFPTRVLPFACRLSTSRRWTRWRQKTVPASTTSAVLTEMEGW